MIVYLSIKPSFPQFLLCLHHFNIDLWQFLLIYFVCMYNTCVEVVLEDQRQCICGDKRTILNRLSSPSTMWILCIKFRSLSLATSNLYPLSHFTVSSLISNGLNFIKSFILWLLPAIIYHIYGLRYVKITVASNNWNDFSIF